MRIRLIHWNAVEAKERAASVRAAGYDVVCEAFGPDGLRELKQELPAAVVIDLGRLPAQGRDVGLAIRHAMATRHVPLVFVAGDPEKVARIQEHLPDAVYTTWNRIRGSLKRAIATPPADPVVPESVFAGYSGTPLPKKLGIKENSVIILAGAPPGFEKTLGDLPSVVTFRREERGLCDLLVWLS